MAGGYGAKEIARALIEEAGLVDVRENQRQPGGVEVGFSARDRHGRPWLFDVAGGFTTYRPGVKRTEQLWKVLAKAAVLQAVGAGPFVVLTAGDSAGVEPLVAATGEGKPVRAVVDLVAPGAAGSLRELCEVQAPG